MFTKLLSVTLAVSQKEYYSFLEDLGDFIQKYDLDSFAKDKTNWFNDFLTHHRSDIPDFMLSLNALLSNNQEFFVSSFTGALPPKIVRNNLRIIHDFHEHLQYIANRGDLLAPGVRDIIWYISEERVCAGLKMLLSTAQCFSIKVTL